MQPILLHLITICLADFLKTNVKEFALIFSEKASKGKFLGPISSKITVMKKKEREKKKERGEGKEEKREKQWLLSEIL